MSSEREMTYERHVNVLNFFCRQTKNKIEGNFFLKKIFFPGNFSFSPKMISEQKNQIFFAEKKIAQISSPKNFFSLKKYFEGKYFFIQMFLSKKFTPRKNIHHIKNI